MREIFKNILGILILATLAYVVFVSFNVYQFTKTDESKITSEGYSQQINLLKEGLENAEKNFSKTSIKDASKNVGINFDGTPIVWVIELEQSQIEISLENIENELFDQGFMTFLNQDRLIIGPYIDKSNLELVNSFLNDNYNLLEQDIIEWKN
ncbi:MAG: hypothetical protein ACJ0F8_01605 [Gammaproteobacteria bacterium]|uniref:Uncharacterized protein n=1 Tax=SAR86 cluster bacterium TaxID=2030880 RepID=A0A520MYN3_9GAMM|nr:MAG: hypothetical protein EVA92_03175 [SAR86 cluster bacterium]